MRGEALARKSNRTSLESLLHVAITGFGSDAAEGPHEGQVPSRKMEDAVMAQHLGSHRRHAGGRLSFRVVSRFALVSVAVASLSVLLGGCRACWFRANICNQNCSDVSVGPTYNVVNGDMDGPTAFGVNVLVVQDPEVWFNTTDNKLYRGATPIEYTETSRTIKVALYDEATISHPSHTTIAFTGIALFFLEYGPYTQTGWQSGGFHHPYRSLPSGFGLYDTQNQMPIVGRFLAFAPGVGSTSTSPFALYLRLIQ
jgi:hypothetical protein